LGHKHAWLNLGLVLQERGDSHNQEGNTEGGNDRQQRAGENEHIANPPCGSGVGSAAAWESA